MALCVPGEGSYARLFAYTDAAGQAALYQKRNAASPFLLEVDRDVSALGVSCWPAARRSSAAPLAVQLLGYLDGEGHGAAGLEAAFDDLLTGSGAGDTLLCTVNAQGKLRAEPVLTPADSGAVGVQLTLSREIQQTAEAVANETMQSGCILVLDTANAKVRACVSRPGYDPENISASLNAPDSPCWNGRSSAMPWARCSSRWWRQRRWRQGRAALSTPAPLVRGGWPDLPLCGRHPPWRGGSGRRAGKELQRLLHPAGAGAGADAVRAMAEKLGLRAGGPAHRCPAHGGGGPAGAGGSCVQRGLRQFLLRAGELLASPLQVAAMMNTIACGGICRTPLLLETTLDETTGAPLTALSHVRSRRVLTKRTAAALQALLAGVVAGGTGHEPPCPARPRQARPARPRPASFPAAQS